MESLSILDSVNEPLVAEQQGLLRVIAHECLGASQACKLE